MSVNNETRKTIEVVAAVIVNESGHVLAVKCPDTKHGGGWEFPGGKIEPGEAPRDAVVRELQEELGVRVSVGNLLHVVEWDYPAFHLSMRCYISRILQGRIQLREHTEARWLDAESLHSVAWLPADIDVLPHVAAYMQVYTRHAEINRK